MNIAILDMYNNVANEGMRCILHAIQTVETADGVPLPYTIFNVRAANELPDLSFDAYISTGGPGIPLPLGEVWEKPYFDLVDLIFAHNHRNKSKKHLFLICHSFQLVTAHLHLATISKRKSTSFGIFPIHRTREGMNEPLFAALAEPFYAVDSRDYQLTGPRINEFKATGAQLLCLEKIRPHINLERAVMAIRFTDEIVGTQFHPEADDEGMLRYFLREEKRTQIIETHGQAKYDEMVAYLQDPTKIALTESVILPGFLRQALRELVLT